MIKINFNKMYNRLLCITIATQIFINTTNMPLNNSVFKYSQYFLWLLMVISFIFIVQVKGIGKRPAICLCIIVSSVIIWIALFRDESLVPILIFSSYCIYIDDKQIIKDYTDGIFLAIIIVVMLCIAGYIPMRTSTNLLTMGFKNPNILGFLLTIAYMGYCILHRKNAILRLLLAGILITFNILFLDDDTASVVLILFYILQQVNSNRVAYIIKKITTFIPELLLIISWAIAYLYGSIKLLNTLNNFLTARPMIWSYYINLYGIKLFPQRIQTYNVSSFEYFFFGKNLPLQYQGFDGAYVYLLITEGVILTFLILFSINYLIIQLDFKQEKVLIFAVLCILIFGITESVAVAPLGYFENFLLILAIKKVILGKDNLNLLFRREK